MSEMIPISRDEIMNRFKKFKRQNQKRYEEFVWEYIEDHFEPEYASAIQPCVMMQVYDELGITPREDNFYLKHVDKIKEKFDIGRNIVEIGSGHIPAFANHLAREQLSINKGTVTIYEPLLITTKPKYPNMTLHRETFGYSTDLERYDLITGLMPCDATETIFECACRNQMDFYVALCGCVHSPGMFMYPFYITTEEYHAWMIDRVKSMLSFYDNGELGIDYIDDGEQDPYPILYNRKK